jgi:hypothetical protein
LKAVQKLLGHESTSTTGDIYTDWDVEQLAESLREAVPEIVPRRGHEIPANQEIIEAMGSKDAKIRTEPSCDRTATELLPSAVEVGRNAEGARHRRLSRF